MDSQNSLLKNSVIFLPESKIFLSESPKVINKTLKLLQKLLNSKSSSGHEECSFDNPVDKQSTKSRRILTQCPKKIGENSKRILLLKIILLPGGLQSWQPSQKIFGQSENFPLNVGTRKSKVFIGKFFCSTCSHVHMESSFWQPCRRVCHKMPMVFCPTSGSFQHFFFKRLLWKRRKQFWQPRQKIFDKKPKTIRSRSKKYITKAFFFKINLASLFFLRHVETSSDNLGGNGFSKSGKFLVNFLKSRKDS